jgi:predicted membrane protein
MIETTTSVWFAGGLVAGLLHATMLWRAAKQLTAWTPILGLLRLGFVAAVLVLSTLSGVILASATGWAIGLAALGTWFLVNRENQSVATSKSHSQRP